MWGFRLFDSYIRKNRNRILCLWVSGCGFIVSLLAGCTSDPYDSGDSSLSYMRADFVDAYTTEARTIETAMTDDGEMLSFDRKLSCEWAEKADSVYRALLYYNVGTSSLSAPIAIKPVYVLRPFEPEEGEVVDTDPVEFESAWKSRNGGYINLGLYVKTGKADNIEARQSIGVACSNIVLNEDGTRQVFLTFCHDQGGVPEYYSTRLYVSVPMNIFRSGDEIHITINTYNGKISRTFVK